MNKHIFIYVDESGTLPDPKGPIIVIAAVATYSINQLILPSKSLQNHCLETMVMKSSFTNQVIKQKKKFLTVLSKSDIQIFALILEKHGRKYQIHLRISQLFVLLFFTIVWTIIKNSVISIILIAISITPLT